MQVDEQYELEVEDLAYGGDGIARPEGQRVVFIARTAPGDRIRARITDVQKRHARAQLLEVIEPGPSRIDPPCPYYEACGGCQLMHVGLDEQRRAKTAQVVGALERMGRKKVPAVPPMWPGEPLRYRNKVTLHSKGGSAFGLYGLDQNTIVEVDSCLLLEPALDAAAQEARKTAAGGRELMVRVTSTGEIQIRLDGRVVSDAPTVEHLGFTLHASSFTQVNTSGGVALVEAVVREAALTGNETVIDLYAGLGVYAFALAGSAKRVIGIEADAATAHEAAARAQRLGLTHVDFRAARSEDAELDEADVIVVDPPRRGLPKSVVSRLRAPKIIYVSCNPTTLARDVHLLEAYALSHLETFDLFAQTYHVETIATLTRKKGRG